MVRSLLSDLYGDREVIVVVKDILRESLVVVMMLIVAIPKNIILIFNHLQKVLLLYGKFSSASCIAGTSLIKIPFPLKHTAITVILIINRHYLIS